MGAVYRAYDPRLEREVALKVVDPELVKDQQFCDRFMKEGRIIAKLSEHPNIITIHDIGIADGYHYIAMEFVDGPDLKTRLRRGLTLPESERHKLTVIHQSAETVGPRAPFKGFFHVAVIGHLRDEKDPLRPALAARELPADSRIQVHQYGKAHTGEWAEQAGQEAAINPRYRWHGEVTRPGMTEVYRRTNLVVLPSLMEGGANVISEAVVAGAPVLASDIPGSIGLLGPDYPGYYPVGDATALAGLLWRAESEVAFLKELEAGCERLRSLFSPQREAASWAALLEKVC